MKILNETFKDNEDEKYDKMFKHKIEKEIKDYLREKSDTSLIEESLKGVKLKKFLKSLKSTLSSGEDQISNIMLKNIGDRFIEVFVHLFNLSIKSGEVPVRWKKVIVKMIPKKSDSKNNPNNYRPISLTNCIARL